MYEIVISICLGVSLAASTGFRVFLPLFVVSLASYNGMIPLNENWVWIGSSLAIWTFGIATLFEILAYYIPWFDNLLDTVAVPLAALAGTAVMVATMAELNPVITWTLAIIAGGGTAATIKSAMGATRLTSTATTAGIANPVVSTVETGFATTMSLISLFTPVLALLMIILMVFFLRKIYKKLFSGSASKSL